jgi:hypothetical protein
MMTIFWLALAAVAYVGHLPLIARCLDEDT